MARSRKWKKCPLADTRRRANGTLDDFSYASGSRRKSLNLNRWFRSAGVPADDASFVLLSLAAAAHLLLCRVRRFRARLLNAVSNAIHFDQHAGRVAEVAADGRTCRKWPQETTSINRVIACEETQIAEVCVDLDYVAKESAVCLENSGSVIDSLLRLSLNAVANQFSDDRVDGTHPCRSPRGKFPVLHPWE